MKEGGPQDSGSEKDVAKWSINGILDRRSVSVHLVGHFEVLLLDPDSNSLGSGSHNLRFLDTPSENLCEAVGSWAAV